VARISHVRIPCLAVAVAMLGCAAAPRAPAVPAGAAPSARAADDDIAAARARGLRRGFAWLPFEPASFEQARREGKFILLDGAAEWCHWCHVMDETTYADPEVGRVLRERFVAIRADVDAHPDVAERYGAWGWPATILFTPDAAEIGKYRGYLPKAELLSILERVTAREAAPAAASSSRDPASSPPPLAALGWIAGRLMVDMDAYFDPREGGWGRRQKAAIGHNAAFDLRRAARGDGEAMKRALLSLARHRELVDPVWGGVYQYSSGASWREPHFEKLMPYQASNLEAWAMGYAATKDPALLADARAVARYLETFLSSPTGAFFASQDADVHAHERDKPFVAGKAFFPLDDARRRALGVPRVDRSVYGFENGLAIAAFVTLHEATGDAAALARARRAADELLRTHVGADGAVRRSETGPRYLADAAGLGFGLARLAAATGDARYVAAATRVAAAMARDFEDRATGSFFDTTPDPAAVGVFAIRQRSFTHNLGAARFYAALARATGDGAARDRGARVLAATMTPKALDDRGRMLGEVLLTLDDLGLVAW
jgi:uncharacterized protein